MVMTKRKSLSVEVDLDNEKFEKKLRVIAKHAEALADELKGIDEEGVGYEVVIDDSRPDVFDQINKQIHEQMKGK
jgi:crotonobetainyl-CoA:carnitine CoA-transferase CaiB-like acyl-CoA transferase